MKIVSDTRNFTYEGKIFQCVACGFHFDNVILWKETIQFGGSDRWAGKYETLFYHTITFRHLS